MSNKRKALKVAALSSLGFGMLFGVFSLVFEFGNWPRAIGVSMLGAFLGMIAAPEIDPKSFKMAWLFQLFSGLASGTVLALLLQMSVVNIIAVAVIGGVLGWSAPYWVKYVPIP